jgi:hypothetical protein
MRVQLLTPQVLRKAASAIAAAAVAFAMLAGSALAAPPLVRDHVTSTGAFAANNVCVGTLCTSTSVFVVVNSGDGPTQACLDIARYESAAGFALLGYETGCAPLTEGAFTIDTKDLTSAALSQIDITLQAFTCDASACQPTGTRTARVSATYIGVGEVGTFRSNSKSTFGGCAMYFVGKGSSREATATLTIDGQSLEAAGSLVASTQKIKVLCH